MKITKKDFSVLQTKTHGENQITLDEDYNVPDSRPDIRRMIQKKGEILIEEVQSGEGKARIQGEFSFQILYVSDTPSGEITCLEGKLPIIESLNLEGLKSGDKVCIKWEIEDITIHLINSRKMNVKAVVAFAAWADESRDIPLPLEIGDINGISVKKKQLQLLGMGVHKKDTFRKKTEIILPPGKPDIKEILWKQFQIQGMDIRAGEESVELKGELSVFVLYKGDDEKASVAWIQQNIPFSGKIPCEGCMSDMIPQVDATMLQEELEVKPDADGEERMLEADAVLELDMKLYQESTENIVTDLYSPQTECVPECCREHLEQLLVKNNSKCRISHKIPVEVQDSRILQICHSFGSVKIDLAEIKEQGIRIQGILQLKILYCISDDQLPFYSMETVIPFTHIVQADGIEKDCTYRLNTQIGQLSTMMLDSNEIEVKAVINLDTLVLKEWEEDIITNVQEKELDIEKLEQLPGIVCYMVQPQDTLWDIARKFYTTMDSIIEINHLEDENIHPWQSLLIVKTAHG